MSVWCLVYIKNYYDVATIVEFHQFVVIGLSPSKYHLAACLFYGGHCGLLISAWFCLIIIAEVNVMYIS